METLKEENDRYDHAAVNIVFRDEQLLCYLSSLGCHLTLSRKQFFSDRSAFNHFCIISY